VREALARLVSEGLVSREPYREFRVVGLSAEEIEEIFHMRALLEGWAVELSALRISQDELDQMRELLLQMKESSSPESVPTLQGIHREFHWIAIKACKKKYLIQMLTRLWDLMLPYAFAEKDTEGFVRQAQKDQIHHLRLVEALEAGAGKQARGILVDHVTEGMEALKRRVKPPDQSGG
jgi:DNA-binding GntR family transcriptional regulator